MPAVSLAACHMQSIGAAANNIGQTCGALGIAIFSLVQAEA